MSDAHMLACLRLTRLRGVGPVLIKRLLESLGSAEAILAAHPSRLASIDGIGTVKAGQIIESLPASEAFAREELDRLHLHHLSLLTLDDPRYPPALKTIPDPPPVLYVRGTLEPQDTVALGIVGARKCTIYGREQSQRLAAELAQAGMTIISGGARGIDTSAHLGALQAGGRTIVVTSCGLLDCYPPENDALYARIVQENRGAIISELPLDAPPSRENFPPRNRIIAGMSLGILVVEANLQSGSLITARLAAGDYGREVFALPGRVDSPASAGTHHLVKSATAHLIESAEDILGHLGDIGAALAKAQNLPQPTSGAPPGHPSGPLSERPPSSEPLTSIQQQIISALCANAASNFTIDDIVDATSMQPQVVMAELTYLQIRGHVQRLPNNRFSATARPTTK